MILRKAVLSGKLFVCSPAPQPVGLFLELPVPSRGVPMLIPDVSEQFTSAKTLKFKIKTLVSFSLVLYDKGYKFFATSVTNTEIKMKPC